MDVQLRENERIDILNKSGLRIIQNTSAPCFSVDAVLLADFVNVKSGQSIIDLGTGTGIIPLLLAAKGGRPMAAPTITIAGLEIMPEMAELARRNVALNGLDDEICIVEGDLKQAETYFKKSNADIITCNPPYYRKESGKISAKPLFAAARTEIYCDLADVMNAAAVLLKVGGSLNLIHRAQRLSEAITLAREYGLMPERLQMIHPYLHAEANLFLMEARKGGQGELKILPALAVYEPGGEYTAEMKRVYANYK